MKTVFVSQAEDRIDNALQNAIDECFLAGGGKVVIENGKYTIGSVRVRSNVTLYLKSGVKIKATRNPDDYFGWKNDKIEPFPEEEITDCIWAYGTEAATANANDFVTKAGSSWNNAIFRFYRAENAGIVAEKGAVIDGSDCYDERGEEKYRGPHGIGVHKSKNLHFSGYKIINTGNWAHSVFISSELDFRDIVCEAGHDGIHITVCDKVTIENCEFYTGDDCVAGYDNDGVVVRNCVMNTACNGMRFGGNDVLVENCRFYGPCKYFFRGSLTLEDKISGNPAPTTGRKNMLAAITYYCDFMYTLRKEPKNIVIRNCTMDNVDRFLHLNFSGNERWQRQCPMRDITIEKVKAREIGMSLCVYATDEKPVTLTVRDSEFDFREGVTEFIRTYAYDKIELDGVRVRGNGDVLIRSWGNDGELVLREVDASGKSLYNETEPFFTNRI